MEALNADLPSLVLTFFHPPQRYRNPDRATTAHPRKREDTKAGEIVAPRTALGCSSPESLAEWQSACLKYSIPCYFCSLALSRCSEVGSDLWGSHGGGEISGRDDQGHGGIGEHQVSYT